LWRPLLDWQLAKGHEYASLVDRISNLGVEFGGPDVLGQYQADQQSQQELATNRGTQLIG
jgi:hypothetical protein